MTRDVLAEMREKLEKRWPTPTRKPNPETGRSGRGVRIKCVQTGAVYPSITAACKELLVDPATICNKTHFDGSYIAPNGKEYIRLDPRTHRECEGTWKYKPNGPTLKRKYNHPALYIEQSDTI